MATLLQDLRYGFRLLWRQRGFTAVAALVLALGIGANTAVFTLVNALVLKPRPGAPDARAGRRLLARSHAAGRLSRVLVSELRSTCARGPISSRRSPATPSRWSASPRATARGACSWTSSPRTSSTRSACRSQRGRTFTDEEERPGADVAGRDPEPRGLAAAGRTRRRHRHDDSPERPSVHRRRRGAARLRRIDGAGLAGAWVPTGVYDTHHQRLHARRPAGARWPIAGITRSSSSRAPVRARRSRPSRRRSRPPARSSSRPSRARTRIRRS